MDKRIEQIERGLKEALTEKSNSFLATVEEDKDFLVDVKDMNGTLYPEVRKIATDGAKGVVPVLKKGSFVIVSRISNSNELFVSMMSEIEGYDIDVGSVNIKIADGNIEVNKGQNDGLVKIDKMIDWMEKVYSDLQNIRELLFSSPIVGNEAPAGIVFIPKTPKPIKATFENPKIKH